MKRGVAGSVETEISVRRLCVRILMDGDFSWSVRSKLLRCWIKLEKVTNQTVVALVAFSESLPAAGLTASVKTGRRRKRMDIPVTIEEDHELSMSVSAYKSICQLAVESSMGKTDAFRIMWTSVWDCELKYMAQVKLVTLADAIRHCSTVDAFASYGAADRRKESSNSSTRVLCGDGGR